MLIPRKSKRKRIKLKGKLRKRKRRVPIIPKSTQVQTKRNTAMALLSMRDSMPFAKNKIMKSKAKSKTTTPTNSILESMQGVKIC